jgi:hypothetical protein
MKKFIFWLTLSSLPVAAFAQNQDQPYRLKVVSKEINTIDSRMNIDLRIYADADVKLNHEVYLQTTPELRLKDHDPEKAYGKIKEYLEAGDSTTISITINYNKKKIPHHHQDVRLLLKSLKPGNFPAEAWAFIYYTQYKTIEIWNHDYFGKVKRSWNAAQSEESPTERVFINRKKIPASDLSDADFNDPNVPKSYKTIPGLDYAIPMHYFEEDGRAENSPAKDNRHFIWTTYYFTMDQ